MGHRTLVGFTVLAAASVAACEGAFDDLERDAPGDSRGAPLGLESRRYPIAMAAVDSADGGATFVAVGENPAGVVTLTYDESGAVTSRGIELPFVDFGSRPAIAGAPGPIDGARGTVVVANDDPSALFRVFDAQNGSEGPRERSFIRRYQCGGPDITDEVTAFAFGKTNLGDADAMDLFVLVGTQLLAFEDFRPDVEPTCYRCTVGTPSGSTGVGMDVATAELPGDLSGDHEEVVYTVAGSGNDPGSLWAFDGQSLAAASGGRCSDGSTAIAGMTSPEDRPEDDFGARIVTGHIDDNGVSDLVLTAPESERFYHAIDFRAEALTGERNVSSMRGFGAELVLADLDGGAGDELAVAAPRADIGEQTWAGQVALFSFEQAGGTYSTTEPIALHDSAPENQQGFGALLGAAPFVVDGVSSQILIVGSSNETFVYFRSHPDATDPRK